MNARSVFKRLAISVILINLFVFVMVGFFLYQSHRQYEHETLDSTRNLVRLLDENISGVLDKIDVVLIAVALEAECRTSQCQIKNQKMTDYVARLFAQVPELNNLGIANAKGDLTSAVKLTAGQNINLADRDYFTFLREHPHAGVIISKPVRGRISGKWVLVIARRINYPDGSFAGIVYGSLSIEYLTKFFSELTVEKHGEIVLRDERLVMLAQYPEPGGEVSAVGSETLSVMIRNVLRSHPNSGTYSTVSKRDNIVRTLSYRRILPYPLYIFVGQAPIDSLGKWRNEAAVVISLVLFFAGVTTFLFWLLYRRLKHELLVAEVLREKNTHLDYALNSYNLILFQIDKDGIFKLSEGKGLSKIGLKSGEVVGLSAFDIYKNQPAISDSIKSAIAGNTICQENIVGPAVFDTTFVPFYDSSGIQDGLIGVAIDITERKLAENSLKESEQKFRRYIEGAPDGVFVINSLGFYQEVNAVGCRLLGYSPEELRTMHVSQIVVKEDLENVESSINILKNENTFSHEVQFLRKDGSTFSGLLSASKINENQFIGFVKDITARKQAEMKVSETMHLLEKSNRIASMGVLAAGITHEINQPLNAMMMLADSSLYWNQQNPGVVPEFIISKFTSIIEGTKRIDNIIKNMRKLWIADTALKKTDLVPIHESIHNTLGLIKGRLGAHGIAVCLDLDPEVFFISGNPLQVEQIFVNLLINALDALDGSSNPAKNIYIKTYQDDVNVVISIIDNGIGFSEEDVDKVFDPFYSSKTAKNGTGLGLAIVKEFVKSMQGTITVKNAPEGGALVTLQFPMARGDK